MPENNEINEFINRLEQQGELVYINHGVDWKYEVRDIIKSTKSNREKNPAILFTNVKDYPGWRIFANALSTIRKVGIALNIDPSFDDSQIIEEFKNRLASGIAPVIDPGVLTDEVTYTDKDVNLFSLPVPWWSREDGGRYIGTWHLNISKDPTTGIRNVGVYRMQLIDSNHTAVSVSSKSHLARQIEMAERKGSSLEMAMSIGVPETMVMAAGASIPYGVDEFHAAGGLAKKPVVLVNCKTIQVEVPKSSEIILEGRIVPKVRIMEGPFLDYAGVPKSNPSALVFEVICLRRKRNPIFRGAAIGYEGAEDHVLYALLAMAGDLDFHGSPVRQRIQNFFLKRGMFRQFQFVGALRQKLKSCC